MMRALAVFVLLATAIVMLIHENLAVAVVLALLAFVLTLTARDR